MIGLPTIHTRRLHLNKWSARYSHRLILIGPSYTITNLTTRLCEPQRLVKSTFEQGVEERERGLTSSTISIPELNYTTTSLFPGVQLSVNRTVVGFKIFLEISFIRTISCRHFFVMCRGHRWLTICAHPVHSLILSSRPLSYLLAAIWLAMYY
ncbi:hypothetical protein BT69DRAFT_518364 [Atractiella rhizophila]|nr:hypothetical protein BT69DRAFT_518364 [Atractiella rhizophila]